MPRFTGNYTGDWKRIATRVKEAAEWRCVRCDCPHTPGCNFMPGETGMVLTVHHFDGDKANNAPWNLMALCQRCHLSVQSRVDPERPLMFDPAPWAMPYIAGFYEAGRGVPGPRYELARWIKLYERETGKAWPMWAPVADEMPERAGVGGCLDQPITTEATHG